MAMNSKQIMQPMNSNKYVQFVFNHWVMSTMQNKSEWRLIKKDWVQL